MLGQRAQRGGGGAGGGGPPPPGAPPPPPARPRGAPPLPDALSAALDLVGVPDPTADDDVSGVGVIVTGSVVPAGAARSLFGKDAQ